MADTTLSPKDECIKHKRLFDFLFVKWYIKAQLLTLEFLLDQHQIFWYLQAIFSGGCLKISTKKGFPWFYYNFFDVWIVSKWVQQVKVKLINPLDVECIMAGHRFLLKKLLGKEFKSSNSFLGRLLRRRCSFEFEKNLTSANTDLFIIHNW